MCRRVGNGAQVYNGWAICFHFITDVVFSQRCFQEETATAISLLMYDHIDLEWTIVQEIIVSIQESWLPVYLEKEKVLSLELIKLKPFFLETAVPSSLPGILLDIDQLLLNLTLSDMNFSLDYYMLFWPNSHGLAIDRVNVITIDFTSHIFYLSESATELISIQLNLNTLLLNNGENGKSNKWSNFRPCMNLDESWKAMAYWGRKQGDINPSFMCVHIYISFIQQWG